MVTPVVQAIDSAPSSLVFDGADGKKDDTIVSSLLEVVVIHHPDDQQFFAAYTAAIKIAFEYAPADPKLSQFKINDPFERIRFTVATTSEAILKSIPEDEVPILFYAEITHKHAKPTIQLVAKGCEHFWLLDL